MHVAVIGSGYWGINLVRNIRSLGALSVVCENNPEAIDQLKKQYPDIKIETSYANLLSNKGIDAVVIATPAESHYDVAKQALLAGKDVFVEKPLALKFSDAEELIALAKEHSRILMVGHLLQYHPGIIALKELVASGELGKLEYIYSNRLNLGKIRTEENILWSFAPHDISVMLSLTGTMPIQVNSIGGSYLQPNIADTTVSTFVFEEGVRGHIYVSWLHPFKEQRLVVVGSKRMITFDDRAPKGHKLILHEKNITMVEGKPVAQKSAGIAVAFNNEQEPLRSECEHFLNCIKTRETPRTDGEEGLRVLKVLQSCQRSLEMSGQPTQVLDYKS